MEDWLKKIHEKVDEERRNYKGPHCCLTMDARISAEYAILYYDLRYHEYGINLSKGRMVMNYCLFCGKKLPISVRDEWFNVLEQEYQLKDPINKDKTRVPQEFLTDEWWKSRGL